MSDAQLYQLILADIAVAGAIVACGGAFEPLDGATYTPGAVRDGWLAREAEGPLRRRVVAMANAGVGALQQLQPERLQEMAARFGVPLGEAQAAAMAAHFIAKRDAWLTYTR